MPTLLERFLAFSLCGFIRLATGVRTIGHAIDTNRLPKPLKDVAVATAVGSSVVGTLLAFHINGAPGPTIVLVQAAVFPVHLSAPFQKRTARGTTGSAGRP